MENKRAAVIFPCFWEGRISGFELSFHMPEEEYVTPVRYMMEPEYIPQAALDQKASGRTGTGGAKGRNVDYRPG